MKEHVVLLGDSVFDNGAYTGDAPDVAAHLREILGDEWEVTLCAIDGTTTTDVGRQFDRVPDSATHVVMSLGGNDALENADILQLPVRSTAEALDVFRDRVEAFDQSYGYALDGLLDLGLDTTVCTIYEADLPAEQATRAHTALRMFNDAIVRAAVQRSVDVIDTRLVCTAPEDFSNAIEPSGTGGRKIAFAVARAIGATESESAPSYVFGGTG